MEFEKNIKKRKTGMPKWMDCTWRRIPCNKPSCKICGRIQRNKMNNLATGNDPDDISLALEDINKTFKEAIEVIKKDAKARGMEIAIRSEELRTPPKPKEYPLYNKMSAWRNGVMEVVSEIAESNEFVIDCDSFQDLAWYVDTLLAKIYRQLSNKWHVKIGDDYGDFDYQYTEYVLSEIIFIIDQSFKDLIMMDLSLKGKLNLFYVYFAGVKNEIKEI